MATVSRSSGGRGRRCSWCGHPCPHRDYAEGLYWFTGRVMCMRCKRREKKGTLGYPRY
jgi:hypothetical protein